MATLLASCISFKISRPRRPRLRFVASAESEIICNSFNTKSGTISGPSIKPVLQSSLIRPSMITDVSSNLGVLEALSDLWVENILKRLVFLVPSPPHCCT